ncbi:MAG: DUF4192 domain-containing protein [Dermatophilaceae bacterium]
MTIIVRTPAALLTAVPYLLGFEPHRSAVAVGCAASDLHQVARFDLPAERGHRRDWAGAASAVLARGGSGRFHLLGYDERGLCGPDLDHLARRLRSQGLLVPLPILVTGERWWQHGCRDRRCCPPGGTPVSVDPVVASEFVARGRAPFASREAMATALAPETSPGAHEIAVRALTDVPPDPADSIWAALADTDRAWAPSAADIGRLAASLRDRQWRDALLGAFVPGLLWLDDLPLAVAGRAARAVHPPSAAFGERVEHWRALVLDRLILLARRSPLDLAAGTFTVVGVVAGLWGHGALANVALDQALAADPDYVLAQLVVQLFSLGTPVAALAVPGADVG